MITELDIHLPLRKAMKEEARRKAVAQKLGISPYRVQGMRLLKDSIDARRRPISRQLRFLVAVDEPLPEAPLPERHYAPLPESAKRVIIVGSGPGGLFAALMVVIGALREIIGLGTFFGVSVTRKIFDPIAVLALPAGAIFVIALFIVVLQYIAKEDSANA